MKTHHVPHGITLETKLLGKVEEYVLDFLLGERYLAFGAP